MKPFVLDPKNLDDPAGLVGVTVTEEGRAAGKRVFQKGHRIGEGDLALLGTLDAPVHAVRLEPHDVHENDAGRRLAGAVAGPGLEIRGPVQSRYNLVATAKGLLRVDEERLLALNLVPGMAVFTLPDRMVVLPGKVAAGVKITPVAVPEADLAAAERIAGDGRPVVAVEAFRPLQVGVVSTEGMPEKMRDRFRETVSRKIGWYGGGVLRFEDVAGEPEAVRGAISGLIADGADVILTAGGNTIDPLDATLLALPGLGAEMLRFGAPAHPGSMFWMARRGDVPIVNLASCSMYSKATVADLVLPTIFAGGEVTSEDLARLGHGGLLDRGMSWRFPPYEVDAVDEGGEE